MARSTPILLLVFLFCVQAKAQRTDKKLEEKIRQAVAGFRGEVGVHVIGLKSNRTVSLFADSIFPTASMIKIPILLGTMDKIEKRELYDTTMLTYKDSLLYAGVDILGSFKNGEKIELSKVIMLMLTMSDNTASLWLQSLAGGGTRINEILGSYGFEKTRVNSRTPGRESARALYGWGQTTPREMASLMEKIYRGQLISKPVSEKMLRRLGRNYWDEVAMAPIPSNIFVASKNGAVDKSRSEVLYVNGPREPYIFCIATRNNQDESWTSDNEAWTMIRNISAIIYDHFNGGKRN